MSSVRRIALTIVLLAIPRPSSPQGMRQISDSTLSAPCADWNGTRLAPEVTGRIHKRSNDVPPFPNEDPHLRDPGAWPSTTRFGGAQCSLRVEELGGGWVRKVRSLKEVRPKNGVCLYYECAPWKGWGSRRGPFYCWYSDGSERWLKERSWKAPDSLRSVTDTYQYYRSGELYRRESRNDSAHPEHFDPQGPYEWFDEVFERNGRLVACGYSKMDGAGAQTMACYYLGKQVGYREFGDRMAEFSRRASGAPAPSK